MFVVAVKSNPLCDLEVGAYASNATDVVAADRVLKAGAGLGETGKVRRSKGARADAVGRQSGRRTKG